MSSMLILLLFCIFLNNVNGGEESIRVNISAHNNALDLKLYKRVLDPVLCREQINYMLHNDTLLLAQFLDAGMRVPRGITTLNLVDLGSYEQCLGIHEETTHSVIDGKYCLIEVPVEQPNFKVPSYVHLPELPTLHIEELNEKSFGIGDDMLSLARKLTEVTQNDFGHLSNETFLSRLKLKLAICIPKACTTRQAIDGLSFNMAPGSGFKYKVKYCRLPNDKPWVTADYVALAVFSIIGLLTLLSTIYDLQHTVLLRRDPKEANKIYQCFSLYTNTRRLVTYTPVPGALECLDGVRAIATMWVIIGHTFIMQLMITDENPLDGIEWMISFRALWIVAAPITVDTFFMMSGMLLVYTSAEKLTRMKLVTRIHLFYLLRFLRIFPVLAAAILLQASFVNRVGDGPMWEIVVEQVHRCRANWWSTLLLIQNFVNPLTMCLEHSWYLAVDFQLHILSPLVLFWILGSKRLGAWFTLTIVLLLSLTSTSIYNVIMEFPGTQTPMSHLDKLERYMVNYYLHTFTRCTPYFVGMMYGYLLHIFRAKEVVMPKLLVTIFWTCSSILTSAIVYSAYPMTKPNWDNQAIDNLANSLMRPAWALAIGWLVFACTHGYSGPINWFLCLPMWKLPSRLSYAMYIIHYPVIILTYSSLVAPFYNSVQFTVYKFTADYLLTMIAAFLLTLLVDSPSTTLIKLFFGNGSNSPQKEEDNETAKKSITGCVNHAFTNDEFKNNFKFIPHD